MARNPFLHPPRAGWRGGVRARAKAERAPNWRVLAVIPADRLDGRDMLLWTVRVVLGSWCDGWRDAVGRPIHGVTQWADVEGPVT
jgi:hypothetical protein